MFSLDQLLSLSNGEIDKIFKHKKVRVHTKSKEEDCEFFVKALALAANPPFLFVGFIDEKDKFHGIENIKNIEVIEQ